MLNWLIRVGFVVLNFDMWFGLLYELVVCVVGNVFVCWCVFFVCFIILF